MQKTLSAKITALVLLLLSFFMLVTGMISYMIARNRLQESQLSKLDALASTRQREIESCLNNYLLHVDMFVSPDILTDTEALAKAEIAEQLQMKQNIELRLRRQAEYFEDLKWAEIRDAETNRIASTEDTPHPGKIKYFSKISDRKNRYALYISYPFAEDGQWYLEFSLPLHDAGNNLMAFIVLRFDMATLMSAVRDYTGLGNSGETVLGVRNGDEIHILTPLRSAPGSGSFPSAPTKINRLIPLMNAVSGKSGIMESHDCRNIAVMAAYRPIARTGWGW